MDDGRSSIVHEISLPIQESPVADHSEAELAEGGAEIPPALEQPDPPAAVQTEPNLTPNVDEYLDLDRKSTRLNSSHS